MHPWLLHNISMNVADTPRMMTSFSAFNSTYQPYEKTATTFAEHTLNAGMPDPGQEVDHRCHRR